MVLYWTNNIAIWSHWLLNLSFVILIFLRPFFLRVKLYRFVRKSALFLSQNDVTYQERVIKWKCSNYYAKKGKCPAKIATTPDGLCVLIDSKMDHNHEPDQVQFLSFQSNKGRLAYLYWLSSGIIDHERSLLSFSPNTTISMKICMLNPIDASVDGVAPWWHWFKLNIN